MKRLALCLLLAACSAGHAAPDAGARPGPWDGSCMGRPGDLGRKVLWRMRVYFCENPGKGDWRFVQHPEARPEWRELDGVVLDGEHVEVLRD